ncbi:hypothetical protein [uncultured Shewanella sp.]|uniref:hypothetical protein n=1 Tax=uncultured Shewanella sp. TaxID=173975 RepID=UPI00260DC392|nr:hypothetical protein [uncultured Shewanella sp.]
MLVLSSVLFFFYTFIQMDLFNAMAAELIEYFNLNAPQSFSIRLHFVSMTSSFGLVISVLTFLEHVVNAYCVHIGFDCCMGHQGNLLSPIILS